VIDGCRATGDDGEDDPSTGAGALMI